MQTKKQIKQIETDHLQYGNGPSYAKDAEIVQSFYNQIKPSMEYEENRIRAILSARFQKPVEVINEYLCFGEYLNELILKTLAKSQIDKNFFERAQRVKRILVKNYRHENNSDHEITGKISNAVLEMFYEYIEYGKFNTKDWQRFYWSTNEFNKRKTPVKLKRRKITKAKRFKYWSGAKEAAEYQEISKEAT
jgi:hypothetical protein